MIKLIAAIYIKIVSICLGINTMATGIYLQVIPPTVKKDPLISEAVQLALIQMLGLVGVAFFTNWKANKIKSEVVAVKTKVAAVETEVIEVKSNVGVVKTEVTELKVQTDGHMTKLLQLTEEKNQRIGEDIGRGKSKAEHEAQSEKDKDSNIAKGKIEGLAEAKNEQSASPTITPTKVEIVQPEGKPAPVIITEIKKENK